jgi:AcrR family transcriptional regulator
VSPYPAQVTRDGIISTARTLIESDGFEDLTLAKLAAALGIKAPSLYKHFVSRAELLKAVNTTTNQLLIDTLRQALTPGEPQAGLLKMAHAYRRFAHTYPVSYGLAFSTTLLEARPDPALLAQLVLPLQEAWAVVVGPEQSLSALRGALALIHGYVMLELNTQFQRGGDLEQVFETVVRAYIAGWLNNRPPT